MKTFASSRPQIAAFGAFLAVMILLAGFQSALASPSQIWMQAGFCVGDGESFLLGNGGGSSTQGCSGSLVYQSTSIVMEDDYSLYYPGDWYDEFVLIGNTGEGIHGAVAAVASTHNLYYSGSYNSGGYVGTNTW